MSMAITKRYEYAREERYGGVIEALDEAGKTGSAKGALVAELRGKQREEVTRSWLIIPRMKWQRR